MCVIILLIMFLYLLHLYTVCVHLCMYTLSMTVSVTGRTHPHRLHGPRSVWGQRPAAAHLCGETQLGRHLVQAGAVGAGGPTERS